MNRLSHGIDRSRSLPDCTVCLSGLTLIVCRTTGSSPLNTEAGLQTPTICQLLGLLSNVRRSASTPGTSTLRELFCSPCALGLVVRYRTQNSLTHVRYTSNKSYSSNAPYIPRHKCRGFTARFGKYRHQARNRAKQHAAI